MTPLEYEIAGLVVLGYRNQWIAWRLGKSETTIKKRLQNLYERRGWSVYEENPRIKLVREVLGGR